MYSKPMKTWKVLSGHSNITSRRHKSQCFLCHCSEMEKVGGWQSQERWMSTRNQRRDFPTQVPSTQPLTQPLPQHAKEHPVITVTTVVLNLDTVPRSTPTFLVYVCLLQLVFDISAFQLAWASLGCQPSLFYTSVLRSTVLQKQTRHIG